MVGRSGAGPQAMAALEKPQRNCNFDVLQGGEAGGRVDTRVDSRVDSRFDTRVDRSGSDDHIGPGDGRFPSFRKFGTG